MTLRKSGHKSYAWQLTRRRLKKQFERAGITQCEICNTGNYLSFAHRLKRRFITTQRELEKVALLCVPCHEKIEFSGHENMFAEITRIIESRECRI
jgi:hypothetical protein